VGEVDEAEERKLIDEFNAEFSRPGAWTIGRPPTSINAQSASDAGNLTNSFERDLGNILSPLRLPGTMAQPIRR
jgi:hypothetical protein